MCLGCTKTEILQHRSETRKAIQGIGELERKFVFLTAWSTSLDKRTASSSFTLNLEYFCYWDLNRSVTCVYFGHKIIECFCRWGWQLPFLLYLPYSRLKVRLALHCEYPLPSSHSQLFLQLWQHFGTALSNGWDKFHCDLTWHSLWSESICYYRPW